MKKLSVLMVMMSILLTCGAAAFADPVPPPIPTPWPTPDKRGPIDPVPPPDPPPDLSQ